MPRRVKKSQNGDPLTDIRWLMWFQDNQLNFPDIKGVTSALLQSSLPLQNSYDSLITCTGILLLVAAVRKKLLLVAGSSLRDTWLKPEYILLPDGLLCWRTDLLLTHPSLLWSHLDLLDRCCVQTAYCIRPLLSLYRKWPEQVSMQLFL